MEPYLQFPRPDYNYDWGVTGWTSSYSEIIGEEANWATLTKEDGRVVMFDLLEDGSYERPDDEPADLTKLPDGTWRVDYLNGESWSFDDRGQIAAKTNWDGQSATVARNIYGNITSVTSSTGTTLTMVYNGSYLTGVTSSDGRTVSYSWNEDGEWTATRPVQGATTYSFDGEGRIASITDATGANVVTNVYDGMHRVVSQTVGDAASPTMFAYNAGTGETVVTDTATGQVLTYRHDARGRMVSATDPAGGVLLQAYGAGGHPESRTNRLGGVAGSVYDDRGNVTSTTDANGITRTATYDSANRPLTVTDPAAGTTTLTYVGSNRIPSTATDGAGAISTNEITDGLVTRSQDADGVVTSTVYDTHRRVQTLTVAPDTLDAATTSYTYDDTGRPLTVTDPLGHITTYAYNAAGLLSSVTDPLGHATTYTYDDAGRLLTTTDPTGAVMSQAYDSSGRLASETTGRGLTTTFAYDSLGQLTSTTFPDGVTTTSDTYLELGRVGSSSDELGRVTGYDYDDDGNVTEVTDAELATTVTQYDTGGRVTNTIDPLARTTSATTYDSAGRVAATAGLGGTSTGYTYDAAGRVHEVTDARGGVVETLYTPGGRIHSVTDAAGVTTTSTYDHAGRLAKETTPSGDTIHRYDAAGREIETVSPGGQVTTRVFDAGGRMTSMTDPAGVTTTLTYTARGELATETVGNNRPISYVYDADGNLISVTDASTSITTFGYDDRNRRTTQTDVAGKVTQWAYDDAGQLTSRTDPLGRTTTFAYDDTGRLTSTTDPSGRSTTTGYDAAGQPESVTYGDSSGVTYSYDAAGRLSTATDSAGATSYEYEPGGLPTRIAGPDGRVMAYRYDQAGRRTAMTLPDGSSYGYGYDTQGRVATITPGETAADTFTAPNASTVDTNKWIQEDGGGSASVQGNRLALSVPATPGASIGVRSTAATTADAEVSLRYRFTDNAKRGFMQVRLRNHPDGYWVALQNDSSTVGLRKTVGGVTTNLGQFTATTDTDDHALRFRVQGDQIKVRVWDPAGPEPATWNIEATDTSITAAGSMKINWTAATVSEDTRVVAIDDVVYQNLAQPPAPVVTYGYDADGNITAETLPGGSRTWTWANGQLTKFEQNLPGATQTTQRTYDTNGRLRWEKVGDLANTYSYDRASQLRMVTPSVGDATTYTYDGRGRRSTATGNGATTNYTYDHAGQLTSATTGSDTTAYTYDAVGRRLTETAPSGTTSYGYDAAGRLATHERAGTTQSRSYSHDGTLNALATTNGGTTNHTRLDWDAAGGMSQLVNMSGTTATNIIGGNHNPAAIRQGTATTGLAVDAHGSVITTTGTATIARADNYDAYGAANGPATFQPRLGYRGELTLDNLTHLRARDYQPGTGAFTTTDPLEGVPGTPTLPNPYHYADNDPTNKTDPTGLRPGTSPFGGDPFLSYAELKALAEQGALEARGFLRRQNVVRQQQYLAGLAHNAMIAQRTSYIARLQAETRLANRGADRGWLQEMLRDPVGSWTTGYNTPAGKTAAWVGGGLAVGAGGFLVCTATVGACAALGSTPLFGPGVQQLTSPTAHAVVRGGAGPVQVGQQGLQYLGIAQNTTRILLPGGGYRMPDILNRSSAVIGEVKNVQSLSLTAQLRDYIAYAHTNGYQFHLYVRASTYLSGPLQQEVARGRVNLFPVLP